MSLIPSRAGRGMVEPSRVTLPVASAVRGPVACDPGPGRAQLRPGCRVPAVDAVGELAATCPLHGPPGAVAFAMAQAADEPLPQGTVPLALRTEDLHLLGPDTGVRP